MTIPKDFKPLLALELSKVKNLPKQCYVSPKIDGLRCIIFGGVAYSRSLKPIPNLYLQSVVKQHEDVLQGLDGELLTTYLTDPMAFNRTQSDLMSIDDEPNFAFHVFDKYHPFKTFSERWATIPDKVELPDFCSILPQGYKENITHEHIQELSDFYTKAGYEGCMLKDRNGLYKHGRSATTTPELIKVKKFTDAEFEVIGYECKYSNQNEAFTSELGNTKRSTKKEGMVAQDTLGRLICRTQAGIEFGVGSGFTDEQRNALWASKESLVGKLAKVKFFEVGIKEAPRFPVFLGFRSEMDM